MRILFTGGGTGGHIYPALEVAKKVVQEGGEALYVGSNYGQESRLCSAANIECINLDTLPFYSLKSYQGWVARRKCSLAVPRAIKILKSYRPQSVFCTGGFSSAPVLIACRLLKIPYCLYILDSIPGRVLLKMASKSDKTFTAFDIEPKYLSHFTKVGMIVRKELITSYQNWEHRKGFKIIVIGGSQGARKMNQVVQETVKNFEDLDIEWVHLAGIREYENCLEGSKKYNIDQNSRYRLFKSLEGEELAKEYASCKLSICRSGASTLGEMSHLGVPGIFVPYPSAYADHQYWNAKQICDEGGGRIIHQKDLDPSSLTESIQKFYHHHQVLKEMSDKIKSWNREDSLDQVFLEMKKHYPY